MLVCMCCSISTARNRADLGGHAARVDSTVENIIQISWPTDLTSELDESEYMRAARAISDQLYGDPAGTWAMDMNQFLVKMPHTLTDTPWHQARRHARRASPIDDRTCCAQDQSYYVPLPDTRACNLWLALGDVSVDMGCLWFIDSPLDAPLPLRPHRPAGGGGGALIAEGFSEAGSTPVPLRAGSITVHSHMTPHFARGNTTDAPRLGYIMQTRPSWSVRDARMLGFDHGRSAGACFQVVVYRQRTSGA